MKLSPFIYSQAIISIAVNVANLCNIVYMLLALRLPAQAFAEITSLLAITFLFSVSQSSARNELLLVHKETKNLQSAIDRTLGTIMPIAMMEGLVLIVTSTVIMRFLHFPTPLPFLIIAGCSITYALNGIMQGIFAAEGKTLRHAAALVTDGIMRIPLALLFFGNGYHSEDTPWIMLIANTCALAMNMYHLTATQRGLLRRGKVHLRMTEDFRTAFFILASTILIGASLKIDILWAKHILSGEEAGAYGIMSFAASVLFLSSSGVGRASISFLQKSNFRTMIRNSYAIMLAICLTCIAGFYAIGLPVLRWLSPDAPSMDLRAQLLLFGAVSAYCIVNFGFQCLSVLHRNIHLPLTGSLVGMQAISLMLFGDSLYTISVIQAVLMTLFAAAYTIVLLRKKPGLTHLHTHTHSHIL